MPISTAGTRPHGRPRRHVRRQFRLVALLTAAAIALAACGGDDADTTSSETGDQTGSATTEQSSSATTAADEDFEADGVLRIGYNLQGSSIGELDHTKSATPSNFDLTRYVFDTLLFDKGDGTYEPHLAESVEVVDASTVDITLKPDLLFSDGAPFDAAALKAGLERNLAGPGRGFKPEFNNVASIDVTGPLTVRVNLSKPVAGSWSILMAAGESYIVSPKAVADGVNLSTTPVGAGPFMVESYTAGSSLKLKKNPNYYGADDVKLSAIEFVYMADFSAGANALRTGDIDLIQTLPYATSTGFANDQAISILRADPGAVWIKLDMCKSGEPFEDPNVRRALSLAIDRDAINEGLFGGNGQPVHTGFFPEGHPFATDAAAEFLEYDPDRARQLLADAGYPDGFSFDAFFTPGDTQQVMEVVQQQWAQVGVTMNMAATTNLFNEFLQNPKRPMAGYSMQYQGIGKFTVTTVTGGVNNVCNYSDPNLDGLADALAAADQATPSQEATELWHEAAELYYGDVLSVNIVFTPIQAAVSKRVGGVVMSPRVSTGSPEPFIFNAYIKKS